MIPALQNMPRAERRRLVRAVERRNWTILVWSVAAVIAAYALFGALSWCAWVQCMTPEFVLWMKQTWPARWMRLTVLAGSVFVILPIVLGSVVARGIRARLIRRAVERELAGTLCLCCGYDVRGTAATNGRVTCPECGREAGARSTIVA